MTEKGKAQQQEKKEIALTAKQEEMLAAAIARRDRANREVTLIVDGILAAASVEKDVVSAHLNDQEHVLEYVEA